MTVLLQSCCSGLTSPQGRLAEVLRYHVVQERVRPTDLQGSFQTLQGEELTVEGSGEDFTVDGDASVVCGNVETQSATLYLVDGVLTPPAS